MFLVIFTGYQKNRDKIIKCIKPGALLINNGTGHNPFVVSDDCPSVAQAVRDALYLKFFNSGQDCAAPDAILVHADVYEEFFRGFLNGLAKLKIGSFYVMTLI